MLQEFLQNHVDKSIDVKYFENSFAMDVVIGKLKAGLINYLKRMFEAIIEKPSCKAMFESNIAQLKPEYVALSVKEFLESRGFYATDEIHNLDIDNDYIINEISHSIAYALFIAVGRLGEQLTPELLGEFRKAFPELSDYTLFSNIFRLKDWAPDELVEKIGVNPLLLDKVVSKPSELDYAVMLMNGAAFSHTNDKAFLSYRDVPERVRLNPFIAILNRQNSSLLERDNQQNEFYLEDKYRHARQEGALPLLIENTAYNMMNMSFHELSSQSGNVKHAELYKAFAAAFIDKLPCEYVRPEFRDKLTRLMGATDFLDLKSKVHKVIFSMASDDDIINFCSGVYGNVAIADFPSGYEAWMDGLQDKKQLNDTIRQFVTFICEHAAYLDTLHKELNRIAKSLVEKNSFDVRNYHALCSFFESPKFPKLDAAFELNANEDVNNYVIGMLIAERLEPKRFFRLLDKAAPYTMMEDLVAKHGQQMLPRLGDLVDMSSSVTDSNYTSLIDIRTDSLADFLSHAELVKPKSTTSLDLELVFAQNSAIQSIGIKRYLSNVNKSHFDVMNDSKNIPDAGADMSFLTGMSL